MKQQEKPRAFMIHSASVNLIKAMIAELQNIGYNVDYESGKYIVCNYTDVIMLESKESFTNLYNGNINHSDDNPTAEKFELPQDWNNALKFAEEMFNHPYWNKQNFEIGDFIFVKEHTDDSVVTGKFIGQVGKVLGFPKEYPDCVTTNFSNSLNPTINFSVDKIRLATPEEIKSFELTQLLEEAKKRYPIGTTVRCDIGSFTNHVFTREDELKIYNSGNISAIGEPWVYFDGKWADIVDNDILGYTPEFKTNSVSFGCQTFSKETALDLVRLIDLKVIKSDFEDQLRSVAKHFEN